MWLRLGDRCWCSLPLVIGLRVLFVAAFGWPLLVQFTSSNWPQSAEKPMRPETDRSDRKRTKTNGNERKPTETNGNQRKPTETNGNERPGMKKLFSGGARGGSLTAHALTACDPSKEGSADFCGPAGIKICGLSFSSGFGCNVRYMWRFGGV